MATRRGLPERISTIKTTEAQQLMMEVEIKNTRMRAVGLVMLFVVCIGVIVAVVLAAFIFNRQSEDRKDEADRREQQTEQGNQILSGINEKLNHIDDVTSKHAGDPPLPPLQTLATSPPTTAKRASPTTTVRRSTSTTSTTRSSTVTSQQTTTTTTQPPSTTTTTARLCVGPVCIQDQGGTTNNERSGKLRPGRPA